MAIKKSDDIANEGSNYANQKNSKKLENITERFDDTTHNDNPYDDAIQYIKKKVDEIVDETNTQTVASGSYATDIKDLFNASSSFAVGGGISELGVAATSASWPTVKITRLQHAFVGSKHTLTIVVSVTSNKGSSSELSTTLTLS